MTLADVRRQFAHWQRYPPLRDLVAGFVGFRPRDPAPSATHDLGAVLALAKAAGGQMRLDHLPSN